jgi:hypothetical protein
MTSPAKLHVPSPHTTTPAKPHVPALHTPAPTAKPHPQTTHSTAPAKAPVPAPKTTAPTPKPHSPAPHTTAVAKPHPPGPSVKPQPFAPVAKPQSPAVSPASPKPSTSGPDGESFAPANPHGTGSGNSHGPSSTKLPLTQPLPNGPLSNKLPKVPVSPGSSVPGGTIPASGGLGGSSPGGNDPGTSNPGTSDPGSGNSGSGNSGGNGMGQGGGGGFAPPGGIGMLLARLAPRGFRMVNGQMAATGTIRPVIKNNGMDVVDTGVMLTYMLTEDGRLMLFNTGGRRLDVCSAVFNPATNTVDAEFVGLDLPSARNTGSGLINFSLGGSGPVFSSMQSIFDGIPGQQPMFNPSPVQSMVFIPD